MKRVLVAVILSLTWFPYVSAEEPVNFADPRLKQIVEGELWVNNPTPTDMLELTSLTARGAGISDLGGWAVRSTCGCWSFARTGSVTSGPFPA